MYEGAAALSSLERWQAAVAHNLANVPVPGFKGDGHAVRGMPMGQLPAATQSGFADVLKGVAPTSDVGVSFADGELVRTGEGTHVAVQGEGFFELQSERGKSIYTRDGTFHVDAENYLVSRGGVRVRGEAGPVMVPPGGGAVTIDEAGNVLQNGTSINKLSIVRIDGKENLARVPGGFIVPGGANVEVTPEPEPRLAPGFYEGSNVTPMDQMVQMISLSRAYETNQKMITVFDNQAEQAIRQLSVT